MHLLTTFSQALVLAAEDADYNSYRDLVQSCCGVLFFGVPNQGIRFFELVGMVGGKRSKELVLSILPDAEGEESQELSRLNANFRSRANAFTRGSAGSLDVLCYYEEHKTEVCEVSFILITIALADLRSDSPVDNQRNGFWLSNPLLHIQELPQNLIMSFLWRVTTGR